MRREKCIWKRILAILLAVATVITTVYQPDRTAWAEKTTVQPETTVSNAIQTEATNSFGTLLNREIEEKLDEQEENGGYNVFSLVVDGTTAKVELEALEDCTLVVGVYDEAGTTMLGSGTADVAAASEEAEVTIAIDSMPAYFDVKAYLIDSETQAPLCSVFDCPNYTQEMQEFLQKDADDFSEKQVLQLDDSEDNNFAVFQDEVQYIEEAEGVNQVTTEDEENHTYVIENASAEIQALQPGDTTALEYHQGQILIIKVASVTLDGTTATIIGEETNLEDVFEYMKIDTVSYTGDATVDTSDVEEGVTYLGMTEAEEEEEQTAAYAAEEPAADAASGSISRSLELSYKLNKKLGNEYASVSLSGSLKLSITTKLKFYITKSRQYFEFTNDYTMKASVGVSGKVSAKLKLPYIEFSPVAGVYIRLKPAFKAEFSGSLTLTAKISGRVGGSITLGSSAKNLCKAPQMETSLQLEGKVYLGLVVEPEIVIISDLLLKTGIELSIGAELSLKQNLLESGSDFIHGCNHCLSGDVSGVSCAEFSLKFLNLEALTLKKKFEKRVKIADCHYSFDYNEFQFRPCSHKGYVAEITVVDKQNNPVPNATIQGTFLTKENGVVKHLTSVTTNAQGKVNTYVPNGKQTVRIRWNIYDMSFVLNKQDKKESITIKVEKRVPIVSSVFPDANFRSYVLRFDKNGDGALSEAEIKKVTEINVQNKNIESMKGIEVFTELKKLDCSRNDLSSLDVSANTNLTYLYCYSNNLTSLDVSGNTKLENLDCGYNELSSLDVSANTKLENLYCGGNDLSSLDVSANTKLENLYCGGNDLSSLDVSKNTKLEDLYCAGNNLSSLDVSANTNLTYLYCYSNNLTSLDVSGNTKLEDLDCAGNNLSSLDVSKNTSLIHLVCFDNQLISLDVSKNTKMKGLACGGNQLSSLDVSNNISLIGLGCSDNQLISLDVSANTKLEELDCCENKLSRLKVSKNISLIEIDCSANQLRSLDVSEATALVWLKCCNNQLSSLDVSKNTELKRLYCCNNQLSSLDVSKNTNLDTLNCDSTVQLIGWSYIIFPDVLLPESAESEVNTLPEEDGSEADRREPSEDEAFLPDIEASDEEAAEEAPDEDVITSPAVYTDLLPNAVYNFYVMRDIEEGISSENLLYIMQITADENGQASIPFAYSTTCETPQAKLVGMEKLDLAEADVTVENLYYTGETQDASLTVVYKGTTLEPGQDYTLTGDYQATELGTYVLQIVGIGLYKGSVEKSYQVLPVPVAKVTLNKTSASLVKGKTLQLKATVTPENAADKTVTWKSSNTKVATVTSSGKVTAKTAGTATITCTAKDGSGVKATCKVTVKNPTSSNVKVTKIKLNQTQATLSPKETLQLKATVTPTNATNKAVTWKSSNTKVATVSSSGKVTAKSAGTATITCTAQDGSGVKATCKITVCTNTEAFVARIYTKALSRTAEEAGLKYWTEEINSGRRTPVEVAESFFFAPEFTNKNLSNAEYVKVLYRTFMGREYDQSGLDYWVARLNKGESRKSVLESFAGCQEFKDIVKGFGL